MFSENYNDARDAIGSGFLTFGLCSLWGMRLLVRGIRDDILDASGHRQAPRAWFVAGGILLQLPLIGYTIYAWRQGYFAQ